jgi:hypothetical protein
LKNRLGALLDLLTWCKKHWAVIEPTQEWIAGKLGWTLRTCQRWIAVAKRLGRLKVSPRYRRTAIYELLPVPCGAQISFDFSDGGVNGGAELKPLIKTSCSSVEDISRVERTHQRKPVSSERSSMAELTPAPMTGFERYFGLFMAAGKAVNGYDVNMARMRWSRMTHQDQLAAYQHAYKLCCETEAQFIPTPERHLASQPWTRRALPRTLPPPLRAADKRAIDRHNEVLKMLGEDVA